MADDVTKSLGMYTDGTDNIAFAAHVNAKDMVALTNGSGGSVVTGDVLVLDPSAAASFTTTTTAGDLRPVFVVPANITGNDSSASKTILSTQVGWVYKAGAYVPAATVDGAVSIGEYLKTSGTAKKFTGTGVQAAAGVTAPAGSCAIALEAAAGAGSVAVKLIDTVHGTPVGSMTIWTTDTAPTGWALCYGQAISRTTYAALFAVIGTTYGVGDGSTTFNVPDMRGRLPLGQDDMGGVSADRVTSAQADSLNGSAGAETHTLTTAELPNNYYVGTAGGSSDLGAGAFAQVQGGGTAHNNMPPYLTLNYIIKT